MTPIPDDPTHPTFPKILHPDAPPILHHAFNRIIHAPAHLRRQTLFDQTVALAHFVHTGALDRHEVLLILLAGALQAGLTKDQASATIESAFTAAQNTKSSAVRARPSAATGHLVTLSPGHPGPQPLTPTLLSDLLAQDFPPLAFLVEGMLARGQLILLGGRPKSGKSWFCLQLAHALDTATPFLGRPTPPQPARVLYIALEDPLLRLHQRCHLLGWQPRHAQLLTDIAHFDGDELATGPGLRQLHALAPNFDLIIIDTLLAALSGQANINHNPQMAAIMNELARLARTHNTAIILVHHANKTHRHNVFDALRGASVLRASYDVGLLLEHTPGEREALLHLESRDVDGLTLTLSFAANGAGWEHLGRSGPVEHIRAGRRILLALLEHGDGLTASQLAQVMSLTRQTVHQQLRNAETLGLVIRTTPSAGNDHGGKSADQWWLADNFKPSPP